MFTVNMSADIWWADEYRESPLALHDPFSAVGRMALTNYLLTGFVAAFISFQWGLGIYSRMMPATGLLIVSVVHVPQVMASLWWLGRYRFGPVEWLWRSFTDGKASTDAPANG